MEELKHYSEIVKKNFETMNGPDYPGKEEELGKQQEEIEKYEQYLKGRSISPESFDKIVNATVEYANNEISFIDLQGIYNLFTN